jgi:probable HAF family extracellular repeat protein
MLDLGTLGGTTSQGNAINNAGQVTGFAWAGAPPDFEYYAFLYSNGTMKDLGTLGDSYSTGLAIDDAGDVAGYYQRQFDSHAFLYTGGMMIDIVPSGPSFTSSPLGHPLNAAAHMTGVYRPSGDSRAFLFRDGGATDLGTLGGEFSVGYAINNADQVTGDSTTSTGEAHAFLWSEGAMRDLGTLGGDFSIGWAINSSGQVTGESATATGPLNPFVYVDGRMVLLDISAFGGNEGFGIDINNSGQVLGNYFRIPDVGETEVHAFLATPISLLFSQLIAKTSGIGPRKSLAHKVRAAEAYYAVPDLRAACAVLAGFVHEVGAQPSNKVAQQTADKLIADAESIERALVC